ncbi:MAG: hypothetical protein Q9175_004859, partial [Cornicularia normoerica]
MLCYTTIPEKKDEELHQNFGVGDWDRLIGDRLPLRAIVKELILGEKPLTHKVAEKILRDLRKMRKMGIYPMGVRARKYRAGLLGDM